MITKDIIDSTNQIVQKITANPDDVLLAIKPRKRQEFVDQIGQLSLQAGAVQNKGELLEVGQTLQQLVANIPDTLLNGSGPIPRLRLDGVSDLTSHEALTPELQGWKCELQHALNVCYHTIKPPLRKWKWFGAFKDDPTWGLMFDEIERQRDAHLVGMAEISPKGTFFLKNGALWARV